jgi:DNA-binding NtrC family response regulator
MKAQFDLVVVEMHRSGMSYSDAVQEFKKTFIATVLRENRGNQCKAATQLGIHRNSLSRIIAELEIDVRAFRPASRRPSASVHALPKSRAAGH